MSPQDSQVLNDDKRGEKSRGSDLRKPNVSVAEEVIGEKRPMTANVQSITNLEEKRKISTSNISKSKKPKIQQIKSH